MCMCKCGCVIVYSTHVLCMYPAILTVDTVCTLPPILTQCVCIYPAVSMLPAVMAQFVCMIRPSVVHST